MKGRAWQWGGRSGWGLVTGCLIVTRGSAQDTLRVRPLDPVVVTAERSRSSVRNSAASVTRLAVEELARMPRVTLADLLRQTPGFNLVELEGLGFDPAIMVRGFYGGGEAEYVIVQIDGKPVNQLQSGTVAWDVLPPLASIEAIEIVRGGSSSLYGDAAIGGVINVITRGAESSRPMARWDVGGGSFSTLRSGIDLAAPLGWKSLALDAGLDHTGGFRDHAERTAFRAQGSVALSYAARSRIAVTAQSHYREFDEPGPLLDSLLAIRRNGSDPLFRFDHTTDQRYAVILEGEKRLSAPMMLRGMVSGELRKLDAIRTLALAPGFGDTKERLASANRVTAQGQLEIDDLMLPGSDRLVLGGEAGRGGLDSKYYRFAGGTRTQYQAGSGARGQLDTQGSSGRTTGALYLEYLVEASAALRLSVGARYDRLHDWFDPEVPAGQNSAWTNHSALSPKAGVNLRYLQRGNSSGNAYLSVSRSFKAPTLDQLYDQRNIPVPFPPFAIQTSNPELNPQHGTNLEAGLYHSTVSQHFEVTGSVSGYQMNMTDELDFDVQSFRYVNIGRSRHRGIEAAANLNAHRTSLFASYTLQAATSRSGENAGKRLKAIPRHSLTGGLSVTPLEGRHRIETSWMVTHVRDIYLDDANTVTLPSYTRVDAQLSFRAAGVTLYLDARNLLNRRYSSSGFLDPSGSGRAYFYPVAGRLLEIGIRSAP